MSFNSRRKLVEISLALILISSCTARLIPTEQTPTPNTLRVIAVESFLADIAQQVAGDEFVVDTLVPYGVDPHVYQPAPKDFTKIAQSDVLVMNGGAWRAGFQSHSIISMASAWSSMHQVDYPTGR